MRALHSLRLLPCCLTVAALSSASLFSASALNVRVLVRAAPQMTVKVPVAVGGTPASALVVAAPLTPAATTSAGSMGSAWQVGVASNGHLTLNGQDAGNGTLYLPPTPRSTVEVGGSIYRGGLLLRVQQGGVQAINVVNVDDYVRGVVAAEMPASWPKSALAAQAIIARTYVAARINPARAYDTCANESCQVYGGISAEKAQTDAAVQATAGQVVAYRGKAASTYFSSDSGGFTASAAEVWGMSNLPYLPAQPDPFSAGGPRSTWKIVVPLAQVQNVAARYGARVGALRSVTVTKLSASGRPTEITFTGAENTFKLSGAEAGGFVRSLGAGSSRASLSGLDPLVMQGSGQGHGVGLSQYGALGLARKGYDHFHILGFYYPGTVLSVLAGVRPSGPVLAQTTPLDTVPPDNVPLDTVPLDTVQLSATAQPSQTSAAQTSQLQTKELLAGTPLGWASE